ncbi:MAG: MoxR family ATPase [Clostridia bacterium]|nr:MoxR family ATPase [Clostridiales bacterium]MBQ6805376.1 MoxR family ATPase [Clostridia bacterium]MDD6682821.1 MoxR family ATPase [Clostridiales bacterium]
MQYADIAGLARRVKENVAKVIIGRDEQLDLILAAIIAKGHVLLEDVPGTGKTVMARSLSKSLACAFSRVQFTPDLLPADITGMSVYQPQTGKFEFVPGPVFTNILLADEINRATPRTQSALLECMEEKQVTEGGVTRKLDAPFLVIATQNPVETQGTFPLPEAQLDRFLIRLSMGYPDEKEALQLMQRFIRNSPLEELEPVAGQEEIRQAQQLFSQCQVSVPVMEYMAALCQATRNEDKTQLGVSPRGLLALLRISQAYAAIQGRDYVIPDDVKKLAVPVLAHRVILRGLYGKSGENEKYIREILDKIPAPTEAAK